MRYLSVCSGIEAATVAWAPLGWEAAAFAEIEAFPRAVLAHRYPDVPLHGDFTQLRGDEHGPVDLLVGGTPCQSFSVAGLRAGLDDPRGNLALAFLRLAARARPVWVVWENVPGVLSSNGGRDFGTFLGALGQLGYGWAYRVLDAQHFGVPQRRRRVFVVGHLGDWRRAAAVLFERESLSGNPPPSRETGEGVTPILEAGARTNSDGNRDGDGIGEPGDAMYTLQSRHQHAVAVLTADGVGTCGADDNQAQAGHLMAYGGNNTRGPVDIATAVNAHGGTGRHDFESETFVAHTLRGEGHDASENGTGRDVPLVAQQPQALYAKGINHNGDTHAGAQEIDTIETLRALRREIGEEAFTQWGFGILGSFQPPEILRAALHGASLRYPPWSRSWVVYCALSREKDCAEGAVQSVRESCREGCSPQGWKPSEQLAGKLGAYLSKLSQPGASAETVMRDLWGSAQGLGVLRQALSTLQEIRQSAVDQNESAHAGQVRRLTVAECEFLQGFPRNYTQVPYRGKPAADSPRYRALGNSMAVPVMRWIGERIAAVEAL